MFASPYRPARLPGTWHPALPQQHRAGDQVAPDAVTLTGPAPAAPRPGRPQTQTPARDPGAGRDPAGPRQRLQKATWSYSGSGSVSPVVSSTCVSSVTM
jgi:hypothetical protein